MSEKPEYMGNIDSCHGIVICSRHNQVSELVGMMRFCQKAKSHGINSHVKSMFYDSNSSVCSFTFRDTVTPDNAVGLMIKACAQLTLWRFDWFGDNCHMDDEALTGTNSRRE